MQKEFDQVLRSENVKRVPLIPGYTRASFRKGMKRQCYTPTRVDSNIGRYNVLFTCVLRCHQRSPKGNGRSLLISNLLAGVNIPSSWLANPNVHRLLIPGHLPTPTLTKRLALSSYVRNCPEGLLYHQSTHYSNGKLFGGRFGAHQYSASPDNRIITYHRDNCFYYVPMT